MRWVGYLERIIRQRRRGWRAWGLAIIIFAVAVAVRLVLQEEPGQIPFLTLFPAIALSALACGFIEGAAVLVLSLLVAWFLFMPPAYSFAIPASKEAVQLLLFLVSGMLLLGLVEGLVQAILKANALAIANADLFKELQHRVANNFQIVAATLQKARRGIADPVAQVAIETAVARIKSMASMHRRLYDASSYADGLSTVLAGILAEMFGDLPILLNIEIEAGDLSVGEMTAITLLVNEAALNAVKHVFRERGGGRFEVSLKEAPQGRLTLLIGDDGPGIPREVQASERPKFGIAVMRSLAEQLGGSLELPEGPGGTIRVTFFKGKSN